MKQLILTEQDKRKIFEESLQYLSEHLMDWNFQLTFNQGKYDIAKNWLNTFDKTIYYELILTELIFQWNGELGFWDMEDDSNFVLFNLDLLNQNIELCDKNDLLTILNDGDYDMDTTDRILQTLIFGEIIYC